MRNWILRDGQKSVLGGTRKHTDECVKIVEETIFENNLIEDTGVQWI